MMNGEGQSQGGMKMLATIYEWVELVPIACIAGVGAIWFRNQWRHHHREILRERGE
jgi:hypothetical protein